MLDQLIKNNWGKMDLKSVVSLEKMCDILYLIIQNDIHKFSTIMCG